MSEACSCPVTGPDPTWRHNAEHQARPEAVACMPSLGAARASSSSFAPQPHSSGRSTRRGNLLRSCLFYIPSLTSVPNKVDDIEAQRSIRGVERCDLGDMVVANKTREAWAP